MYVCCLSKRGTLKTPSLWIVQRVLPERPVTFRCGVTVPVSAMAFTADDDGTSLLVPTRSRCSVTEVGCRSAAGDTCGRQTVTRTPLTAQTGTLTLIPTQ